MFAQLYQNIIIKNPKTIFIVLLISLISFGYFSKDFRLDASSETLLIEDDQILNIFKKYQKDMVLNFDFNLYTKRRHDY